MLPVAACKLKSRSQWMEVDRSLQHEKSAQEKRWAPVAYPEPICSLGEARAKPRANASVVGERYLIQPDRIVGLRVVAIHLEGNVNHVGVN